MWGKRSMAETWVDILVPMLGRAWAIDRLVDDVIATYEPGYRYHLWFIVSESDTEVLEAAHNSGEDFVVVRHAPGPGDYARKINAAFSGTDADWVLLGASDIHLHDGWAKNAIEMGDAYGVGVVGTNDLGNPTVLRGLHSTHPLVRRSYIDERGGGWDGPGVVYHEGYEHQYVDTELVTAAQARGQWVFCHESKVEHMHPYWHKAEMDSTYEIALARGAHDARLFRARSRAVAR